jgi:hypothetical protein
MFPVFTERMAERHDSHRQRYPEVGCHCDYFIKALFMLRVSGCTGIKMAISAPEKYIRNEENRGVPASMEEEPVPNPGKKGRVYE